MPASNMEPDRGVLEDHSRFNGTPLSGSMLLAGRVNHFSLNMYCRNPVPNLSPLPITHDLGWAFDGLFWRETKGRPKGSEKRGSRAVVRRLVSAGKKESERVSAKGNRPF